MKCIALGTWLGMLLLQLGNVRGEYPGLTMRPWFDSGGVLVPVSDAERLNNGGAVILEGMVEKPNAVRLEFSLWNGTEFSASTDRATKANPIWNFRAKDLNYKVGKEIPAGARFNVRIFNEDSKKPYSTILTDMAVGPVWVLCASPATDAFELPVLSADARARVRVLVLEGADWKGAKGVWRRAEAVEKAGDRLFCGMPRAFANALCERLNSGTNKDLAIGLVIIPKEFIPPSVGRVQQGQESNDLTIFSASPLANGNAWLKAGSSSALAANTAETVTGDGVLQRRTRALARYREEGYELQREGKVGAPFPKVFHRWEHILIGPDAMQPVRALGREVVPFLVPFRVTGLVWGEDRSYLELEKAK